MGLQMVTRLVVLSGALFFTSSVMWSLCEVVWSVSAVVAIKLGILSLLVGLAGLLCLDMCRYNPADSFKLPQLVRQYLLVLVVKLFGPFLYRYIRKRTGNCKETQAKTLEWILRENGGTAYGRDHNLSSITGPEDFIKKHPLTNYAPYAAYAERVAKGESNVMTRDEVVILGLSSGTTGKNKMYPYTNAARIEMMKSIGASIYTIRNSFLSLGRVFQFRLYHPARQNEAGIKLGGLGSVIADVQPYNVVPKCFLSIDKEGASFYAQAVFALIDREVAQINGFSSDLLYAFFQFAQRHSDVLCDAIEYGVMRSFPGLSDEIRWELNAHLRADPLRAHELRAIFGSESRLGMARLIWPRLKYVMMAKGGGFAHSAALLQASYLHGVDCGFPAHMATEGLFGVVLEGSVTQDTYTMLPNMCFLEFIPVENMAEENPKTLLMHELKAGESYEIVVTNIYGLYRNRFGDVIQVVGTTDGTPKYKFLYRAGQILTIAYDRTPEKVVYEAVRSAERAWGNIDIVDYTATESYQTEAITGKHYKVGCYVIFVEAASSTGAGESPILTQKHTELLEKALCEKHETYGEYRKQESLGHVDIIQVKPGTFTQVRPIVAGGAASTQFKMPRVLRKKEALAFLWENRVVDEQMDMSLMEDAVKISHQDLLEDSTC